MFSHKLTMNYCDIQICIECTKDILAKLIIQYPNNFINEYLLISFVLSSKSSKEFKLVALSIKV